MFSPQAGSPAAELAAGITDTDTVIPLVDVSIVPAAPNILTMKGENSFETIIYEEVDEGTNELKQVTRGVEGTAQSWTSGQEIARNMTAQDIQVLQDEIETLIVLTEPLWLQSDDSSIREVTTYQAIETDESTINSATTYNAIETDETEIKEVTTNVS